MRETKMDRVYNSMRNRINNNEYLPNTPITETAVCKEFGVSRTPAREALRKLQAENYLTLTPGIGLTVTNIDLTDLIEVYEIREVLEGIATRLYCNRKSPTSIRKLSDLLKRQQEAFDKSDSSAFMKYDMEFHHTIFKECGNKRLLASLEEIYDLINRIAFINKDDTALDQLALRQHQELYDCIATDDRFQAEELVKNHVRELKSYYLKRYYNI